MFISKYFVPIRLYNKSQEKNYSKGSFEFWLQTTVLLKLTGRQIRCCCQFFFPLMDIYVSYTILVEVTDYAILCLQGQEVVPLRIQILRIHYQMAYLLNIFTKHNYQSIHEVYCYIKESKYKKSSYLVEMIQKYQALHRGCGPST